MATLLQKLGIYFFLENQIQRHQMNCHPVLQINEVQGETEEQHQQQEPCQVSHEYSMLALSVYAHL
jgi:hypothetical protein